MNPETLGRLLYGEHWQGPLAAALGVSKMTVWRWMTMGSNRMPIARHDAARQAASERYNELIAAAQLTAYDMARALWPSHTRAQLAALVRIHPSTITRAGDDWERWRPAIDTARARQVRDIWTWAREQMGVV